MNKFEELYNLNVNDKTERKNGLTYLSWAWAWAEMKKAYPEATYEVLKNENGLPYFKDEKTGYMVYTKVTADGITHEMWLPVMDYRNKAMIDNCTMFDVNKTIMRCLTKNLAMFGIGLYIYAGEDLPEGEQPEPPKNDLLSPICPKCGKPVKGFKRPDGTHVSGAEVLEKLGMCTACNKAEQK